MTKLSASELVGLTAVKPMPQRPPRPKLAPGFTRRVPARVQKNSWYFIEDNLIEDGYVALQWFPASFGEARCSSMTSRLLNASDEARAELMCNYSQAVAIMPTAFMVDVSKWAPREMKARRAAIDPIAALREGVDQLLAEMMTCKKTDIETRMAFAARYARLRDRMAYTRDTFVHVEGAFELMQDKLVDFMEDGD